MPKKKKDDLESIGQKIKKVRTKKKMPLDAMANETGFSIDYLKKIEAGKKIPPVGALLQIARALEIDSTFFLREEASNLQKRVRAYTKRTDNYAYTTLTPGAENKHLKAFKISIEPLQDHEGVGYQHEGRRIRLCPAGISRNHRGRTCEYPGRRRLAAFQFRHPAPHAQHQRYPVRHAGGGLRPLSPVETCATNGPTGGTYAFPVHR